MLKVAINFGSAFCAVFPTGRLSLWKHHFFFLFLFLFLLFVYKNKFGLAKKCCFVSCPGTGRYSFLSLSRRLLALAALCAGWVARVLALVECVAWCSWFQLLGPLPAVRRGLNCCRKPTGRCWLGIAAVISRYYPLLQINMEKKQQQQKFISNFSSFFKFPISNF